MPAVTTRRKSLRQPPTAGRRARKSRNARRQARFSAAAELVENCVGTYPLPLGEAKHFMLHRVPRPLLLAIEERTVVAALSKGAKCALPRGFFGAALAATMTAQIQYARLPDPPAVLAALRARRHEIEKRIAEFTPEEFKRCTGIAVPTPRFVGIPGRRGTDWKPDTQVIVELVVGTGDAMGANVVTRLAQRAAREVLHEIVGCKPRSVICTNDYAGRDVSASATFTVPGGREHRDAFMDLYYLSLYDRKRTVTHNKGIMNAITAIGIAAGQDTRAIEACVHEAADAGYGLRPFTSYEAIGEDQVAGTITLTLPVGTVGGATSYGPAAANREKMKIEDSSDLAIVMASAGLAQNFAALLSLTGEGICEAHRRVCSRSRACKR